MGCANERGVMPRARSTLQLIPHGDLVSRRAQSALKACSYVRSACSWQPKWLAMHGTLQPASTTGVTASRKRAGWDTDYLRKLLTLA